MARCVRFALLVLLLIGPAVPALAQVYRWTDDQGNVHYADKLLGIPERYRSRAEPLGYRSAPAPPPGAAAASRPTIAAGGASIKYTPGQRILVDVRLNGRASARLLLDTGADVTLINPSSLSAAGVDLLRAPGRGEIRGVTGSERVMYVMLDSLEIGDARVDRLPVVAYEMGSRESDGLLGRDFLDRFNVTIDSSRGLVTLTPK
jgi:predicted aspartyl protease